jgi:hypothetical protein
LVLYDVSSICLKGRCGPLVQHDDSREHRDDRPQLVIALLSAADGRSVAVEVFAGNTADPATLVRQVETLWQRFSFGGSQAKADRLHSRCSTITTWPKSPVSDADAARARLDSICVRCACLPLVRRVHQKLSKFRPIGFDDELRVHAVVKAKPISTKVRCSWRVVRLGRYAMGTFQICP